MADAKDIIGTNALIRVERVSNVPAKIDTGADSSSVWASNIQVTKDGILEFSLFGPESPLYTGQILRRKDYKVAVVRSSNGAEQIRYRTHITLTIGGRRVVAFCTLSDRTANNFPVLIGRRTIKNRFIVDVSKRDLTNPPKNPKSRTLNQEFVRDPYKFHQKYIGQEDK